MLRLSPCLLPQLSVKNHVNLEIGLFPFCQSHLPRDAAEGVFLQQRRDHDVKCFLALRVQLRVDACRRHML